MSLLSYRLVRKEVYSIDNMYVSPAKKEIEGSTHERRRQIEIFSGKLNLTGGGGVDFRQGPHYIVLHNIT